MKQLSWTKKQFLRFKQECINALNSNKNSFFFEGDEFFTSYAKYLIEYLEPHFKRNNIYVYSYGV